MTTENISLTRALAEVGTLDDRITKAIAAARFVGVVAGKEGKPTDRQFRDRGELESRIKADVQSIDALIARRAAIKAAITKANVLTSVTIVGREMTIAEAVELKRSMAVQERLLLTMKSSVQRGVQEIVALAKALDEKIATLVQHSFQNVSKPTPEQFESVSKPQVDQFGPDLLDPLDVKTRIEKLERHIEDVKLNLDFALSEVNAKTEITISY
jgi:hypothetical protein